MSSSALRRLVPSLKQFRAWTLPSKASFFSAVLAIIALLIALVALPYQRTIFSWSLKDLWFADSSPDSAIFDRGDREAIAAVSRCAPLFDSSGRATIGWKPLRVIGREGLDFAVVYLTEGQLRVAIFRSDAGSLPEPVVTLQPDLLRHIDYVPVIRGKPPGLLVTAWGGAGGAALELSLFVRTRRSPAYVDLFHGIKLDNAPTAFFDVYGDGLAELVTIQNCELRLYRLSVGIRRLRYERASTTSENVSKLLAKTILGQGILTYYTAWKTEGCSDIMDDRGGFFDEISGSAERSAREALALDRVVNGSLRLKRDSTSGRWKGTGWDISR